MKICALEEHDVLPSVAAAWARLPDRRRDPIASFDTASDLGRNLASLDEQRLTLMADAGIDVQVLSLTTPGLFDLPAADAVALQSPVNDEIADAVTRRPQRFQALATVAPQDPEQAAAELERAVRRLGVDGALIFTPRRGTADRPQAVLASVRGRRSATCSGPTENDTTATRNTKAKPPPVTATATSAPAEHLAENRGQR